MSEVRVVARESIWRNRDFVRLWLGQAASEFAGQVGAFTLPLVAVLALGASATEVAALHFLGQLPYLLVALYAGALIDRVRRRSVLLTVDLARAVVLAVVPVLWWTGGLSTGALYAVAFVGGVGTVFFQVAYQAYLPSLVEREHLGGGNGLLETSRSAALTVAPALAGGLVQVWSAPGAVLAAVGGYAVSALMFWRIRFREAVRETVLPGARGTLAEIGAGVRLVFGHPVLRANALVAGIFNFAFFGFTTVSVVFFARTLELSAGRIGVIMAAIGPGLLAGAVLAVVLPRRIGYGRTLVGSALVANTAMQFVALVHGNGWFSVAALAVIYFVFTTLGTANNVTMLTVRQLSTPPEMLGRVAASIRFVAQGASPLGALFGGAVAAVFGLRAGVAITAGAFMVALVALVLSPLRRIGRAL